MLESGGGGRQVEAPMNSIAELQFSSQVSGERAFQELELDCVFTTAGGGEFVVPGFWAGGSDWRVRFSSPTVGSYPFRTRSVDPALDGLEGVIDVTPYGGDNKLLRHGAVGVSLDGRRFQHADGTPFLWVGDTWWYAFVTRLGWPDEFQGLTRDRVEKGYSVVQLVAGLYPEMKAFDSRGDGDRGWPWTADFGAVNPAWWDAADQRVEWLVASELMPCVVGAWGYYLLWTGVEKMKKHWRYVVARWGAHPVIWCLGGETRLPWYDDIFTERCDGISRELSGGWAEVSDYVRQIDPNGRLITAHPSPGDGSWSTTDVFFGDRSKCDFVMLQTGHWDKQSFKPSLDTLEREMALEPPLPVLNGEVCYEGILSSNWQETQRFLFWSNMLSGAAGHTYGAQGIWAFEVSAGSAWGDTIWKDAAEYAGGRHVGLGAQILRKLPWSKLSRQPTWITPHANGEDRCLPFAAGIPGQLRLFYFPGFAILRVPDGAGVSLTYEHVVLRELEPAVTYTASFVNPRSGESFDSWEVRGDANGDYELPVTSFITSMPSLDDWLLILDARDSGLD